MRFLVDECTGPMVARWLRIEGHDVFSVYEEQRGLRDEEILEKAYSEARMIVTNDKDFGEKIFREHAPHCGVILLRLEDERAKNKILSLQRLFETYSTLSFTDRFIVVTETKVRFTG